MLGCTSNLGNHVCGVLHVPEPLRHASQVISPLRPMPHGSLLFARLHVLVEPAACQDPAASSPALGPATCITNPIAEGKPLAPVQLPPCANNAMLCKTGTAEPKKRRSFITGPWTLRMLQGTLNLSCQTNPLLHLFAVTHLTSDMKWYRMAWIMVSV